MIGIPTKIPVIGIRNITTLNVIKAISVIDRNISNIGFSRFRFY